MREKAKRLCTLIPLVWVLTIIMVIDGCSILRINLTASVPRGVYLRVPQGDITYGSYVVFKLSDTLASQMSIAPWYPKGEFFIKEVIGVEGDTIESAHNGYSINNTELFPRFNQDRYGNTLPQELESISTVPPDSLILGSDHPYSFDSRYFGAVHTSELDGVYRLLWSWE